MPVMTMPGEKGQNPDKLISFPRQSSWVTHGIATHIWHESNEGGQSNFQLRSANMVTL